MAKLFTPVSGMTCFLEPTGNAARRWDGTPLQGKVTEIGRRNFSVQIDNRDTVISVKRSSCVYSDSSNSGFIVFGSLEDFQKEQERKRLHKAFVAGYTKSFSGTRLSYDALKMICEIMENEGFGG